MTDYFALLGFERRPWLDPELVKQRFLELSAKAHPDRVHEGSGAQVRGATDAFAELNAAATKLGNAKERLHHLLALEGETIANSSTISRELMDLFWRVGQTTLEVDRFLLEKSKASSPIVQAHLFSQGLPWSDRIAELQQAVAREQESVEAQLKEISSRWPSEKPFDRLKILAQTLAATGKWEAQLKERFAALAAF